MDAKQRQEIKDQLYELVEKETQMFEASFDATKKEFPEATNEILQNTVYLIIKTIVDEQVKLYDKANAELKDKLQDKSFMQNIYNQVKEKGDTNGNE